MVTRLGIIVLASFLILSLAFSIPKLQAAQQATIFQKTWGSSGDEIGTAIARDSSGNIYVSGAYNYGFYSNHGTSDAMLLKYDAYGNLLWARSWGGSQEDVGFSEAIDSSGNVLVAGWTASYGSGSYDAVLLKFSPSGNLLWEKTVGSVRFERAYGIALDPSDNIYLTGVYNSTLGDKLFIVKLDSSGALQWQKLWNAPAGLGYSIAIDSSSNVYAAGFFINATGHEAVLLKFNLSGALLWQRAWGNLTATGNHVALDSSGNAYMTGEYDPNFVSHAFIVKFDPSGTLLWQRVYAQGVGAGVAIDSSGVVYNSGWRYRTPAQQTSDVFLMRFNSTGGLLSQGIWGGVKSSLSYAVASDNAGHAIVAGGINGTGPYAISPTTYTLSNPNFKADITTYVLNLTSFSVNALSVAAAIPAGVETYGGGFDSFIFEYGAASVSCGPSCTASFQSNATITSASYDSAANALLLIFTGSSGTQGNANVTIPKSTVRNQDSNNIKVAVNQITLPSSALNIRMNSTHFFVYFTFTFHSNVGVDISLGIIGVSIPPGIALAALLLSAPVFRQMRRPHAVGD